MEQLFSPPGASWTPVSPKLVPATRLVLLLSRTPLLVVGTLVATLVPVARPWAVGVVVVLAVLTLGQLLWIPVQVRRWGYAEREDDLWIRRGALFRVLVAVPYGRMQYVDVRSGPIDRAFGIATVTLHTASPGTTATVPGLPAAEASRLRDRLTELGEAQRSGL